jgi:hemerythrin-like domain-containing protein
MTTETLAEALEREHREIDEGIERFLDGLERGSAERAPLEQAVLALRRHIYLEEAFLFPPLRAAGMFAPIVVMLREHGEIWDALDALEGPAADPAAAAAACRALLEQLERHNAKEEPIIYPQADVMLEPEAADRLRTFVAEGRLPDGWVCERAGAAAR